MKSLDTSSRGGMPPKIAWKNGLEIAPPLWRSVKGSDYAGQPETVEAFNVAMSERATESAPCLLSPSRDSFQRSSPPVGLGLSSHSDSPDFTDRCDVVLDVFGDIVSGDHNGQQYECGRDLCLCPNQAGGTHLADSCRKHLESCNNCDFTACGDCMFEHEKTCKAVRR